MSRKLAALALPMLLLAPGDWSPARALDRFLNKDLRKLSDRAKRPFYTAIGEVEPKVLTVGPDLTFPWYWWKATGARPSRYVLMRGAGLFTIPGDSYAGVVLYDASLHKIKTWSFSAGHRINLYDAAIEYSGDLDTDVILLKSGAVINGEDVAKQYFAFSGDQLRFVRLEDHRGALALNYYSRGAPLGILPEAKTADEWFELLQSPKKADQLAALVFLGGEHRAILWMPDRGDPQPEAFLKVVNDPRIRQSIQRLQKSSSLWLKQAADLASRHLR
jgi:hypothetical protein